MIGQLNIQNHIDTYIKNGTMPGFLILSGVKGLGKKTLAEYIAKKLNKELALFDNKVDDVRSMITYSNTMEKPMVYCLCEYEGMSINAKNSILKITEEPPQNSTIILTAFDKNTILPTILSRGICFDLQEYTKDEIVSICKFNNWDINLVEYTYVPGQIELLSKMNIKEFNDFIQFVHDNIAKAGYGNALKITNKLALKDNNGYDLDIFLNGIEKVFLKDIDYNNISSIKRCLSIQTLCEETRQLLSRTYSKQPIMDEFIINLKNYSRIA